MAIKFSQLEKKEEINIDSEKIESPTLGVVRFDEISDLDFHPRNLVNFKTSAGRKIQIQESGGIFNKRISSIEFQKFQKAINEGVKNATQHSN